MCHVCGSMWPPGSRRRGGPLAVMLRFVCVMRMLYYSSCALPYVELIVNSGTKLMCVYTKIYGGFFVVKLFHQLANAEIKQGK